jgi:hypothetical protein
LPPWGKADIKVWRRHACFLSRLRPSRTGNAEFARHLRSLAHQFLVGHVVECASLANLAAIDDKAQNTRHSDRRRHHRGGIALVERQLARDCVAEH